MYTPDQIQAENKARVQAIFDRFVPVQEPKSDNLVKSEGEKVKDTYWTADDLNKFKEDLFKGIDEGTIGEEELEKAQEDLLSLKKECRLIEGKEVEVFVKG